MSELQKKNTIQPDAFSEKELSHLLFASYPTRINRYNLEFFCFQKKRHSLSIGSRENLISPGMQEMVIYFLIKIYVVK